MRHETWHPAKFRLIADLHPTRTDANVDFWGTNARRIHPMKSAAHPSDNCASAMEARATTPLPSTPCRDRLKTLRGVPLGTAPAICPRDDERYPVDLTSGT